MFPVGQREYLKIDFKTSPDGDHRSYYTFPTKEMKFCENAQIKHNPLTISYQMSNNYKIYLMDLLTKVHIVFETK